MNIKEIASVADLMTKHDLTEFSIESEELRLVIRRDRERPVVHQAMPVGAATPVAPAQPPPAETGAAQPAAGKAEEAPAPAKTIDSPIVGTFYQAPSPGADPFVAEGQQVDEETVVCIVEAMKVMNEVKAECKGTIKRCLVDNAQPVEYGQPLFELA